MILIDPEDEKSLSGPCQWWWLAVPLGGIVAAIAMLTVIWVVA